MKTIYLVLFFCVCLYSCEKKVKKSRLRAVRWWTLAHAESMNNMVVPQTQIQNPTSLPLTRKQRNLVSKNPGSIRAVYQGAKQAILECKYQFKNRRWNCPTYESGRGVSVFGKILQKGCRETAFIYAITSAAISHAVARACAAGTIYTCSCDYSAKPPGHETATPGSSNWKWGGCSDNAKFGHKFGRRFVDVVEKGQDIRYMMNLHNNAAGRVHVTTQMTQACKCHGMSGSCQIQTCWMKLPSFRRVGDLLKDRFDGASRVLPGNAGSDRRRRRKFTFTPYDPNHKAPSKKDLVYFEKSPEFCNQNNNIGFKGTVGRECNDTSLGLEGCDLMCCGRGHKTQTYTVVERCNCTFRWCCEVMCEACRITKMKHTCL